MYTDIFIISILYLQVCVHLFLFIDCIKSDDVGARECDPEGTDSDPSRGSTVVAAHVDQATYPGDTIDRTIALVDDTRDALSSSSNRECRLLITWRFLRKVFVRKLAMNTRENSPYVFIRDNCYYESTLNCQIFLSFSALRKQHKTDFSRSIAVSEEIRIKSEETSEILLFLVGIIIHFKCNYIYHCCLNANKKR